MGQSEPTRMSLQRFQAWVEKFEGVNAPSFAPEPAQVVSANNAASEETAELVWLRAQAIDADRPHEAVAKAFGLDTETCLTAFMAGSLPEGVEPSVAAAWAQS